jgi:hypothetical protein
MRLSLEERRHILAAVDGLDANAEVRLFGSRVRAVTLLSVVPLKIGNNNCKPGETYRKTPSIC